MFQNEYEPDNPLQRIWASTDTSGACLCTMRESCSVCSNYNERRKQKNLIIEIAKTQGYQLYSKRWMSDEMFKLDMELVL